MAYVPVPKDFSKIKTKLALNLTKRQIICFSLAGICGVPVYLLTKAGLGTDVAATLMIIVMLPFFFFACVQQSWTTLAGVSPVTVIASEPCS